MVEHTASSSGAAHPPHSPAKGWVVCGALGKGCLFPSSSRCIPLSTAIPVPGQDNAHRSGAKGIQNLDAHRDVEPPLRHPRMAPTAAGTQSRAGFARASKLVQDSPEFKVSSTGVSSHWPLQWGPG